MEAHKKYIDVQFVAEGEEYFGYAPLSDQTITEPYKEENDIIFYEGDKSLCRFSKGMFSIFFPDDLHMPGVMIGNPAKVKKVVVKVKLD